MCSTQNAKSMFSYKIKIHTKLDYGYVTIHRRHTFKFQHHFAVAAQILIMVAGGLGSGSSAVCSTTSYRKPIGFYRQLEHFLPS